MGFVNNSVPFTLVAWAESRSTVNVGVASVLDSAIPLFGQLFAHFFLPGERITVRRVIGIAIGFAGVFVVCSEKIFDTQGDVCARARIGLAPYAGRRAEPAVPSPRRRVDIHVQGVRHWLLHDDRRRDRVVWARQRCVACMGARRRPAGRLRGPRTELAAQCTASECCLSSIRYWPPPDRS